ncbi:MAG TPA: ABC transporter permease subunit [Mycobacteriales bacterium]|nr:ABC transporter permease subunit [Mycobacteriales bacterium]
MIIMLARQHVYLALVPVAVGLLVALPLGYLAARWRRFYPPLLAVSGILYSIPSLAMFVALPGLLGTKILDPLNIVVALSIYTVALLARTVVDGLASVPEHVLQAATAMGFGRIRRLIKVELPIAVPVVVAGLRVAAVANISLVSVGAVIGVGGLGQLFTSGFQLDFLTPIYVGVGLLVLLALVVDTLLVLGQRLLTPWVRAGRAR